MAWEEYDPKTLRTIMTRHGLNAGDVARRSKGKVGRATVRELTIGRNPRARTATIEAVARALSVSPSNLRGDE